MTTAQCVGNSLSVERFGISMKIEVLNGPEDALNVVLSPIDATRTVEKGVDEFWTRWFPKSWF